MQSLTVTKTLHTCLFICVVYADCMCNQRGNSSRNYKPWHTLSQNMLTPINFMMNVKLKISWDEFYLYILAWQSK